MPCRSSSRFSRFGAGIVAGDTGIALHNRGSLFSLRSGHPNLLAPGKRPFHTLCAGHGPEGQASMAVVRRHGRRHAAAGSRAGASQPDRFGMNVQDAGEAPRFMHSAAGLALESAISRETRSGLDARGHSLVTRSACSAASRGFCIDPRRQVSYWGIRIRGRTALAIGSRTSPSTSA